MKFLLLTSTLLVLCSCCCRAQEPHKAENLTFVATKEWQTISKEQTLPAGLHVRINLKTGKREAKLYDENEPLQDASRNLAIDYRTENDGMMKRLRKPFDEMRRNFEELRHKFHSDSEFIVHLMEQFGNLSKTEKTIKVKLQMLENFEYLLHQYDNALIFTDQGGLQQVLLPLIVNETKTELRISAMRVLGSIAQNHPHVQTKVYELNFGSHLTQILLTSTHRQELSTALYAFGSLLRRYPYAQQRLMSTSGMQALMGLLTKEDCDPKVISKVLTLICDLVEEKKYVLEGKVGMEVDDAEKVKYEVLNLVEMLNDHGYCEAVSSILTTKLAYFIDEPDYMQSFEVALRITSPLCRTSWSANAQLRHALLTIKNRYLHSGDEYRLELAELIAEHCDNLYGKRKAHDEF